MASHSYMTVTGKQQGLISAGCSGQSSIGNKCQAGHENEIMVLAYSHTMSNVGNVHRTQHRPITLVKHIDKSSPLLAQALANREEIKCRIDFYRISATSQYEKYYTIEIFDGQVADLTLDVPHAILQNDAQPQEQVSFRYRDIIWTHHIAGTSGHSFWEGAQWQG